ncbi:MAG: general secretion pathway protein GspK [Gemmatimonadales bacterium]
MDVHELMREWSRAAERSRSPFTVDRSPQSGFALFTVLWLIVALSVVTTLALGTGRVGRWESANRIALRRGRWAADACLEIFLGRYAAQGAVPLDSVDLGSGTWCRARIEDPGAKLNINTASDSALAAVLGNDTLAAALLDWRDPDDSTRVGGAEREWYLLMHRTPPRNGPFAGVAELRLVRGFDSAMVVRADSVLTVRGPGHVNVNDAFPAVLETLPGFTPFVLDVVLRARADHRSFGDLDALVYAVPGPARAGLLAAYAALRQQTVFAPELLIAHLEGHAPESPAVARIDVTLVPAGARLAVVRREVW